MVTINGTRQACLGCRAIKVKCRLSDKPNAGNRCARCDRLDLACEYRSAKRGRPSNTQKRTLEAASILCDQAGKRSVPAETTAQIHSSSAATNIFGTNESSSTSLERYHKNNMLPAVSPPELIYSNNSRNSRSSNVAAALPAASPTYTISPFASDGTVATSNSNPHIPPPFEQEQNSAASISVDVVDSLDPSFRLSSADKKTSSIVNSSTDNVYGDPIDLGYLTRQEAIYLIQCFHGHLNPLIALFDPSLHTLEYVRSSSTILFNAILAASAKFFRNDLFHQLDAHAYKAVNKAVLDGICELGVIQALCIRVFWKSPSDKTAYLKVGHAVRLGFQLNLHVLRTTALPENVDQANQILDAERTWQVLYFFDASYSDAFSRPRTISRAQVRDMGKWLSEAFRDPLNTDAKLMSSLTHDDLVRLLQFCQQSKSNREVVLPMVDYAEALGKVYARDWFEGTTPYHMPRWSLQSERLHYQYLCCNLSKIRLQICQDELSRIDNFQTVHKLIDRVSEITNENRLLFYQDVAAIILSKVGIMMYELYNSSDTLKQSTLNLMMKVFSLCTEAAAGQDDVAPAYVARFYTRLLTDIFSLPTNNIFKTTTSTFPTPAAPTPGDHQVHISSFSSLPLTTSASTTSPTTHNLSHPSNVHFEMTNFSTESTVPAPNVTDSGSNDTWINLENLLSNSSMEANESLWTDASYWSSLFSERPEANFFNLPSMEGM